jgi:glycosyltransferase involved in cell wall biosynthesis
LLRPGRERRARRRSKGWVFRRGICTEMRVLNVVQSYFPFQERGGTAFKVRAIARGLARRGYEVTVLTADLGLRKAQAGASAAPLHSCDSGWLSREDGVTTVYLPTLAHYRALTLNPRVMRFCRASLARFDLVHFYGLYDLLGPVVGRFCRRQGIPYVVEPMGMYRPIVRSFALKRLYHRAFGKRLVAGARFVIATSEQERRELAGAGIDASRILIRRNGVEIPDTLPERGKFRRRWNISEDAKVILFLGRIISKKRPDLLLEAFVAWREQDRRRDNSILVIAGPEERDGFGAQLRAMVKSLGVFESVLFPGPLYDLEKWQAYRDADVFVLPSENENFGNTAAESAACGTPVIVTNSCGIAPFLEDAGIIVAPMREAIVQALTRILQDDAFSVRCRRAAPDLARRLSWDVPLHESERLYQQCIGSPLLQELVS